MYAFCLSRLSLHRLPQLIKTRVSFSLYRETLSAWQNFLDGIDFQNTGKAVWVIESRTVNANPKYHSGAQMSISRGAAAVKRWDCEKEFYLRSNEEMRSLTSNVCALLFLPTGIVLKKGGQFSFHPYEQVSCRASTTTMVEKGRIYRDAEIVDYTWEHPNVDGSPDRRYKANPKIPICEYGIFTLSLGGRDVEIETSNSRTVYDVRESYQRYKDYLTP